MNQKVIAVAVVSLVLSTGTLAAQQPQQRSPRDSARASMKLNMQQHTRMMDSADARLDTLVRRMNGATGNAKISAMAQVINELVSQRRAMQAHMRQMMQSHGQMMGGQMMRAGGDSVRAQTNKARPAAGGTDTSGHAEHHPEN
jgi:hypothetical protein